MEPSWRMIVHALVMSMLAHICVGQGSGSSLIEPETRVLKANTPNYKSLFSCQFMNVTGSFKLAWTLNGEVISNSTYVFKYPENFDALGQGNHGTLAVINLSLDFHGSNFTCRLYNDSVDLRLLTATSSVEPVYETSAGILRIPNAPSEADPGCELALIPAHEDSHRIEFSCCVTLTREELMLSLIQKTVVYGENTTNIIEDLSENRRQCFPHTVSESALNDGNFQCVLESRLYGVEPKCAFHSFRPSINLSRLEPKGADLTCDHDSEDDIIGYSWSIDKDVDYTLSEDRRHCFINEELTHPSVLVSCTLFTRHGFGSAKLQLNVQQNVNPTPASWGTVILIGICMGAIICCLFVFIIGYLIYKRGVCFCFKPPERYTPNDLRRMQLERESIAHFYKFRQPHTHRGGGGESVSFITPNGGGLRYQSPMEEEEDIPPIPGGDKDPSHLLDYADLDHGNATPNVAEDPSLPQRPDNSKVEYADILKPPTKSLRDMR